MTTTDPSITPAPSDPTAPADPGTVTPALPPDQQLLADATQLGVLHATYDTARDALTAAQTAFKTVSDQTTADVAAAQALAAQQLAGAQAAVDAAQATADAAHKAVAAEIVTVVADANALADA